MSVPAAFLSVVLIWSTTPLAIQWSSQDGGFLFGISARMVLSVFVCLVLVALTSRRMLWHRRALASYLVAGLGIWGAMTAVYWGAQHVPSGLVSVVFGLTPLVTALMAALWLDEPSLTFPRLAGIAASLVGLWVIFGQGPGVDPALGLGLVGLLVSVTIHSASSVWLKRIDAGLHPLETTTGALMIAVPLFLLDWWLLDGGLPEALGRRTLLSIVYLAVFGSVLGFVLYYYLLAKVQASRVALITLLTPVLALALGEAVNGEQVELGTVLGTGIILAGLSLFHWGDALRWRRSAACSADSRR